MSTRKLNNISIALFRTFLINAGCHFERTNGGHEIWKRKDLYRPIVFQTHINPIPEFIVKNALRLLGLGKDDFWNTIEQ